RPRRPRRQRACRRGRGAPLGGRLRRARRQAAVGRAGQRAAPPLGARRPHGGGGRRTGRSDRARGRRPAGRRGAGSGRMSLAVVGTGTEVGKTIVSAVLCARYGADRPVPYWKPVATGSVEGRDTETVARLAGDRAVVLP